MDIISILTKVAPVALAALAAALAALAGSYLIYSLYKKRGGKRIITKRQFLVSFLLLGWLVVVLGITLFNRPASFAGWFNFRLFSGYVNSWNNWSLSEFQLIIFNMLMFTPLGVLLPLLHKSMRKVLPVFLTSLIVCVSIEVLQMLTHRGVFELDDIFHNTLGSMIGYFICEAVSICLERRKLTLKPILRALVIPFAFVLLFCGALAAYQLKELGNLSIRPAIPQNMAQVDLKLNIELPTTAQTAALYYNDRIANLAYGKEQATRVAEAFGLQQRGGMRIDGSNRVFYFQNEAGIESYFTYSLSDGVWTFLCEAISPVTDQTSLAEQAERFEAWLFKYDLLPSAAVFRIQNGDTLRWDANAPQEIAQGKASHYAGQVMIQPSVEADLPHSLFYDIVENAYIRQVQLIAPNQAYIALQNGQFEQYQDLVPGDRLCVDHYELVYVYDTKGFYQPVYEFQGTLNDEPWSCRIPAVA